MDPVGTYYIVSVCGANPTFVFYSGIVITPFGRQEDLLLICI